MVIRPVKEMTRVITSMASGDFTVSMKVKGNDEIAVMGRSVEHFYCINEGNDPADGTCFRPPGKTGWIKQECFG